jgi:uncharacterized protein YoxC
MLTLIAVIIGALALVAQAVFLWGIFKAVRSMNDRVNVLLPKVDATLESSRVAIEEARVTMAEFRQKSNTLFDSGQKQINQLDLLLTDVTKRSSKQLAYAEAIVEDALSRVEDTVAMVHKGVIKPIRSISSVAAGVGAAMQYLLSRKPNLERATLDEEMYI